MVDNQLSDKIDCFSNLAKTGFAYICPTIRLQIRRFDREYAGCKTKYLIMQSQQRNEESCNDTKKMLGTQTADNEVDTLLAKDLVPIIDLARNIKENSEQSYNARVGNDLHKALSEKGMALLVNHGITDEQLKTVWNDLDVFVDLPNVVKEKYLRAGGNNHGYVSPGVERFDGKTPEFRHTFNICTLNAKHLPEEHLPGFADRVSGLSQEFKALTNFLLRTLAISLGISETFFVDNHMHMLSGNRANETTLRLIYYPPVPENKNLENSPSDEVVIRCGAHSDYGTFTLLAQDSEGGLEVQLPKSDKWHRVGHLPGAIFLNCGEILSLWTQSRYAALKHRVVVPEQNHVRSRGRHSMAFFCHPDNLTKISPKDMLVLGQNQTDKQQNTEDAEDEKVYNAYELIQMRFQATYK